MIDSDPNFPYRFSEPSRSEFIESCLSEGISDSQCQFNLFVFDVFLNIIVYIVLLSSISFSIFIASELYRIFYPFSTYNEFDRVFLNLVQVNFWREQNLLIEEFILFILKSDSLTTPQIFSRFHNTGFGYPFPVVAVTLYRLKKRGFINFKIIYLDSGFRARQWFLIDLGVEYCSLDEETIKLSIEERVSDN